MASVSELPLTDAILLALRYFFSMTAAPSFATIISIYIYCAALLLKKFHLLKGALLLKIFVV